MRARAGRTAGVAPLAALLAALPAAAQDREAGADTLRPVPLEPVVVTVLRSPVALGQAPYAVSVVGESELTRGKTATNLEEVLQGLPGVQIQNRFNYAVGERLSVRGFGARAQFGVRGVKLLVDGIPATLPDGQSTLDHVDLASLGRVEALRGPAATLYGNAAGGVLDFRTRPPAAVPLRQEVEAVAGSGGLSRLQALTSGTSGGTGYLVSVGRIGYEGFRTNPLEPDGRPYGQATRWHLNATLTHPLAGGELRVVANGADLRSENPGSLSDSLLALGDRQAFANNVRQRTGKDVRQGHLGASWSGPVAETVTAHTVAYGLARSVENPIPAQIIDLDRRAAGGRILVQSSGAGLVRWSGGVEGDVQRDDRLNFANVQGEAGDATLDQLERVRGVGVFGRATVPVGTRAEASGGLRYDRFLFEVEDRFPALPDESGARVMDAFSPSVGLHLQATPDVGVYASVSTSFETPTTTELANRPEGAGGFNPDLEPQRSLTVEGGVRGRGGDRLAWELAAYRTSVRDELVPFEVPAQPGRSFFRNVGRSRHVGMEASLFTRPAPELSLQVTYSYTDARFREYVVGGTDLADRRVPGLAPHRATAILRGGRGPWYGEVRGEYLDRMPVNDANTAASPSYWLADVRGGADGLALAGARVSPFAGVTNVFDRRYNAAVAVNAFGGRFFEPGPARGFYAGLRVAAPVSPARARPGEP